MNAKRLGVAGLVALAVVIGVVVDPTQVVIGRLLGDNVFEGRPTRYWVRALQSGPAERAEAFSRLERGGAAAVPVLVSIMSRSAGESDAQTRSTSIDILARLGPDAKDAGPALVAALRDADPHIRSVAAAALPRIEVPAQTAVPALTELLTTEHSVVAARALGVYRGAAASALPALVELLQDASRPTEARWNAARTIGKIGPDATHTVPVLIDVLDDAEATVREHAAEAIGDIGASAAPAGVPALVGVLSDPAPRVRRDAVRSLGYIGEASRSAVPEIKRLLEDPEAIVREAAKAALKAVAPEEAAAEEQRKENPSRPATTDGQVEVQR